MQILPWGTPPHPVTQQAPAEKKNPWAEMFPNLLGNIVMSMVQGKLKQKFEIEPASAAARELEQSRQSATRSIEEMREAAAGKRTSETVAGHLKAAGWREDANGQLVPPGSGLAPEINVPGHTAYRDAQGNLKFQRNQPSVALELPGVDGLPGQTIKDVSPDQAASVYGQLAGREPKKSDYTQPQVIDDTRNYYKDRAVEIDTKYGTRTPLGDFNISSEAKAQWEKERTELRQQELSDIARVGQGLKPSWQLYNEQKQKNSSAVSNFLKSFGASGGY